MKVAIIGVGLIGGSVAKKIRASKFATQIIGVDKNQKHCKNALEINLVDEIKTIDEVLSVDLIVVSVPVNISLTVILYLLDNVLPHTVIMDMGSTKQILCEFVQNHKNRKQFVATHPIAGTEKSGPLAAIENLYQGKITIICEKEKSSKEALNLVTKLYKCLEMNIIKMNAEDHDKHIAYVSHLSHVSSFALGYTVLQIEKNEKTIFDMAGSGFASTVRLAKSSPDMWTPIFEQNSQNLIKALDVYIENLIFFRNQIANKKSKKIYNYIKKTNKIYGVLKGIENKNK